MAQVQRRRKDDEELFSLDRRLPVVTQIYDRLRQLIVELRLRPHESISKAELAKKFGVSESPVREALLRLAEEGLVVIKPQSGTYVAPIDEEKAAEARFLRLSIEIEVVKQLCKSIDEESLAELGSILARQRFHCENHEREAFSRQDSAFHLAMYRMAGVAGLWRAVAAMRAHLTRLRMLDIPQPGTMTSIISEHQAIFEAVSVHDALAAEAAVRHHLSGTVAPIETLKAKHPEYF
jgi:GntR family transcriptional regulator, rspAB operon transcriptional repressor